MPSPMLETPAVRSFLSFSVVLAAGACIPPGNSTPSDAGSGSSSLATTPPPRPSVGVMTATFEDNFDRPGLSADAAAPGRSAFADAAPARDAAGEGRALERGERGAGDAGDGGGRGDGAAAENPRDIARREAALAAAAADESLGPNWRQAQTSVWHIENGRLCGQGAHNHGVWLNRVLPVNARIEFDAITESTDGDLKAEVWGDGQSSARSISYTDATSYLTVFGGWKNTFHVLARINEHGNDRKEIKIDPTSDDPREKPVTRGQSYHFRIERTDGRTIKWSVDGVDMLSYEDSTPLTGAGHDHFGFNDWEVKVCFDNVKVTPIASM